MDAACYKATSWTAQDSEAISDMRKAVAGQEVGASDRYCMEGSAQTIAVACENVKKAEAEELVMDRGQAERRDEHTGQRAGFREQAAAAAGPCDASVLLCRIGWSWARVGWHRDICSATALLDVVQGRERGLKMAATARSASNLMVFRLASVMGAFRAREAAHCRIAVAAGAAAAVLKCGKNMVRASYWTLVGHHCSCLSSLGLMEETDGVAAHVRQTSVSSRWEKSLRTAVHATQGRTSDVVNMPKCKVSGESNDCSD